MGGNPYGGPGCSRVSSTTSFLDCEESQPKRWRGKCVRLALGVPSWELGLDECLERKVHRGYPAQLLGTPLVLLLATDPPTNAPFFVRTVGRWRVAAAQPPLSNGVGQQVDRTPVCD